MPEPSRRRLFEAFAPFLFLSSCRPADAPPTAPPAGSPQGPPLPSLRAAPRISFSEPTPGGKLPATSRRETSPLSRSPAPGREPPRHAAARAWPSPTARSRKARAQVRPPWQPWNKKRCPGLAIHRARQPASQPNAYSPGLREEPATGPPTKGDAGCGSTRNERALPVKKDV